MTRLEKIKEDYAKEKGWSQWNKQMFFPDDITDEIAERYAQESVKAILTEVRNKMKPRPRMKDYDRGFYDTETHLNNLIDWAEKVELSIDEKIEEL